MIMMKLGGGLGNQMFQYALGKSLAVKRSEKLLLDVSTYGYDKDNKYYRSYGLTHFNTDAGIATQEEIERIKYPFGKLARKIKVALSYRILRRHHIKYEPGLFKRKGDLYLEGYWQSYKYFNDIRETIIKDFSLRKPFSAAAQETAKNIRDAKNSVSIHVRRGDYVASAANIRIYGSHCNAKYYAKALSILSGEKGPLSVFVFSDDIEWVKKNIAIPHKTTYVSETSAPDYERMMLMSLTESHVICNSTFGWWSAWLDDKKGKKVIAPSIWIPGIDLPIDDILPPEWIRI